VTTRPGEPGPAHLPEPVRRYRGTAEHVLDALLETAPEWATRSGDHRFDGRAADLSPAGVAHDGALLRQAASALDDLDDLALDLDDRVDLEILRAAVMRRLWQAEDLTVHTWNPLAHLPRDLPAGPPGDGRPAGLARLAAVPRGLEVAREVLGEMPRLHVEAAVARVGTLRGRPRR